MHNPQPPSFSQSVWPIAWVSFFWSFGSLMVFSVLPPFLQDVLKVSHTQIGLIEGIAVASAFASKVVSGIISDWLQKRRPLILVGSFISTVTKPMFALASGWGMVFFTRFIDRISKGIRAAPTDALIADISHPLELGRTYSIRQCLYALGAVTGCLAAMCILSLYGHQYRLIFSIAMIPALLAIVGICLWVQDCIKPTQDAPRAWNMRYLSELPPTFWRIVIFTGFLMIARFSETFMVLKAKSTGWPIHLLPLMIIIIDLFHAGFSLLNKRLLNHLGTEKLLIYGLLLLIGADICFYQAQGAGLIVLGVMCNGIHLGLTQGILRALIARHCPKHLFGTAFAIFYLVSGLAVLGGNYLAGKVSDSFGLSYAFIGGLFSTICALAYGYLCMFRVTRHPVEAIS